MNRTSLPDKAKAKRNLRIVWFFLCKFGRCFLDSVVILVFVFGCVAVLLGIVDLTVAVVNRWGVFGAIVEGVVAFILVVGIIVATDETRTAIYRGEI